MAEAAVENLLKNLKNLLLYHPKLIANTKNEIEDLYTNFRLLNAFLKDSLRKRRNDEPTKVLDRNIRDVVYEVEDVIDGFVTQAFDKKKTSYFSKSSNSSIDLHEIGKKVVEVKEKVKRARIDFANLSVPDEDKYDKPAEARPPRQNDVVGFEDVTQELTHRLNKETDYFDVVCLIGMFGLGKTTLAWKIFRNPEIINKFSVRIWLSISQEFSDKDIFLAILKEFTTITDDIREKDAKEIARIVAEYLEQGSFFIVFDDVWTCGDWERLRYALPNKYNKGKVLITSRIEDVGSYACKPRQPHQLRFFTEDETWELLRLEALGKLDCPTELVSVGQLIAMCCKGLPLVIVIIGGILATKYLESDLSATRKAWEEVSMQVSRYINEDPEHRMSIFISLSYSELPLHLRPCFLYLGMFPKGYEIPASKLILMWIGEGFIQQSNDSSLEETGEKYLEDLINRNLVRIEKRKRDGRVKTCRIGDALHEFCQSEANNENQNFLQEIKLINGVFSPPVSDLPNYRHLCVHSDCLNFISSIPFGPRVRSFVCFSKDEIILPLENIINIFNAFKLLRVLDAKPIRLHKFILSFFELIHMRYIALSVNYSTLPSRFSNLWNLQTLIINTTSRKLEVKADIWELTQLRHFKINASVYLPRPGKHSKHGAELQTLGTLSVDSCTEQLFEQACNLKKLGIRGQLEYLFKDKKGVFDSLGKLKNLETLKLINDVHPRPPSEGHLNGLPQPYQFPSRLKSLTLRATFLDWSYMSILGLLVNLEVLKVKDKAFMGNTWDALDGGFRRLEFLHIEETDLVFWNASSHHFSRLRGLVLRNCDKLLGVPVGLADIPSFQMLELYNCRSAVASARKIEEAKRKAEAEGSLHSNSLFSIILNDLS